MSPEHTKYLIDQIRKDKIIYACEACAINLACILIFLFSATQETSIARDIMMFGSVIMMLGYTSYMGFGNLKRLKRIQQLESTLSSED
ncbi:hypothetical protein KC571_03760 [candidate division WWE3 bacterium]|uniref:Uncharacterized protein n=1 Tax=candidate division WWE3 bacterium TaxID=2053526 RepID=A0A955LHH6_UNCKA|nr:hypothetical protein [candidate division WWE3 bacterium]